MKLCKLCNTNLPLTDFHRHKATKDGRNSYCKSCMKDYKTKYDKEHQDRNAEYRKEYNKKNVEKHKQDWQVRYSNPKYREYHLNKNKKWREDQTDLYKNSQLNWRKANPEKLAEYSSFHRSNRKKAVPSWFSDWDKFVIQEAHKLRHLRFKHTGIRWELDHIIPISGKKVCGLHIADNLQVIPSSENKRKLNKYEVL